MRHLFVAALALILSSLPAQAAPERYVLEKPHTQILFFSSHEGFSLSKGEFLGFDGSFVFDADNWAASTAEVTIVAKSLEFHFEPWNAHMRSPDFFDVEKHPTITFRSTNLKKTGKRTGKLTGDLTLLGVTRPVVLDLTFNKSGEHPYTKFYLSGFSARGTLNRKDFGMAPAMSLPDGVELRIEVEGIRQDEENLKRVKAFEEKMKGGK